MTTSFYDGLISRLPLLYVFLSGIGFSIQGLVVKILTEQGYHASLHLVIMRGLVQFLLSCVFIYLNVDVHEDPPPKLFGNTSYVRKMLFLRSTIGFVSIAASYKAVEYIPVGDSTVLVMLSPMIAAILGYIILGEPWRIPEFVATIIAIIGALFVARPPFIFGDSHQDEGDPTTFYTGVFIALFASLNAAFAFIFVRILGTSAKMPWPYVTFSQSLAQILFSYPLMMALKVPFNQHFTWYSIGMLFVGGFVGTWSQAAMTIGMQREKSASASAMRLSDVVFGFIWQAYFTTDSINTLALIGAVLITCSILVVVIFKPPQTPPPNSFPVTNEMQAKDNQIEMIETPSINKDMKDMKLQQQKSTPRSIQDILARNLIKFSNSSQSPNNHHTSPFRYAKLSQQENIHEDDDDDDNNVKS